MSQQDLYSYGNPHANNNFNKISHRIPPARNLYSAMGAKFAANMKPLNSLPAPKRPDDLVLKKVGYKVPEAQKKAVIAAISTYSVIPAEKEVEPAPKNKGGRKRTNPELQALITAELRQHKDESKVVKKVRVDAIKAQFKGLQTVTEPNMTKGENYQMKRKAMKEAKAAEKATVNAAAVGGAGAAAAAAPAEEGTKGRKKAEKGATIELDLGDGDLAVEATSEQVDKVASALKKFHGEIGDPPYHIAKVKAELEKMSKDNLKIVARDLKLSGKISKMNKTALITMLTNYMETD